ncbi:pentapeptide repeat-containing protein [Methylocystis echinoides]|uniref:pentapeptide repeat-containing protein n=1 Tax=Methylocystis echinoides TaxID=29468 RepID=UPI0024937837|nr:pentapeptide repeat-containing protein [Methylocystis echinoides]
MQISFPRAIRRQPEGSECLGCNFTRADLGNADFTGAKLQEDVIYAATLNNANFTSADLTPRPHHRWGTRRQIHQCTARRSEPRR